MNVRSSVLVAVPEPAIAAAIAGALRRRGHEVKTVASAAEALAAEEPDVLVCDLALAGGGGLDLLDALLRRALDLGAAELLPSPFRLGDLVRAVEGGETKLHVDGPIFSRAMSRLLEHALCVSRETVLLWARGAEGETTFGILHEVSPPIGPRDPRLGTAELGCELARRDLDRLGATFARRRTDTSQSRTEVRYSIGRSPRERA